MHNVAYIASYFVDGLPSLGLGKNKGRRTAIGYFLNKQCVVSFPARLNGRNVPTMSEAAAILRGDGVADAMREFNGEPAAQKWEKERDELGWVHHFPTGTPGYWMKVEKTPAGDYTICARHDDDIAGGELDYRDDLRTAKRLAESLAASGNWTDYTMFPEEARAALEAQQRGTPDEENARALDAEQARANAAAALMNKGAP
jgi:hypothetical protein